MSLQSVLSGISALVAKRQQERLGSFKALVVALADGKDADPVEVEGLLTAAGKSPADLAADVGRVLEKRRLEKLVGEEGKLQAERGRLDAEAGEFRQKAESARLAWVEASDRIKPQLDTIDGKLGDIATAKVKLAEFTREDADPERMQQAADLLRTAYERELTAKKIRKEEQSIRADAVRHVPQPMPGPSPLLAFGKRTGESVERIDPDKLATADRMAAEASTIEAEVARLRDQAHKLEAAAIAG